MWHTACPRVLPPATGTAASCPECPRPSLNPGTAPPLNPPRALRAVRPRGCRAPFLPLSSSRLFHFWRQTSPASSVPRAGPAAPWEGWRSHRSARRYPSSRGVCREGTLGILCPNPGVPTVIRGSSCNPTAPPGTLSTQSFRFSPGNLNFPAQRRGKAPDPKQAGFYHLRDKILISGGFSLKPIKNGFGEILFPKKVAQSLLRPAGNPVGNNFQTCQISRSCKNPKELRDEVTRRKSTSSHFLTRKLPQKAWIFG